MRDVEKLNLLEGEKRQKHFGIPAIAAGETDEV